MDMPKAMPKALKTPPKPEVQVSRALSLFALPGEQTIRTRRVAIFVADGVDGEAAAALHAALEEQGAVPRYVGARLGTVRTEDRGTLQVEVTFETMPSVLFDAVAVVGGKAAAKALGNVGHALEFLKDQYRHAKPLLALRAGAELLESAGVPSALPSGKPDPGVIVIRDAQASEALPAFIKAIARHRHHEREVDPPEV
jgi:catalase